jgi:hypothetical protein
VFLFAGDGEFGGAMEIAAGSGSTSGGGSFYIYSGDGSDSGEILIRTGIADAGVGGGIFLRCQSSRDAGGLIQLDAGNASEGPGGDIEILAGLSNNNPGADNGGTIYITAGNTISGSTGQGGDVLVTAGRNLIDPQYSGAISFTTENVERLRIDNTGAFFVAGSAGLAAQKLSSAGPGVPAVWAETAASGAPATATDPGRAGEVRYDSSFIYVCVAVNTWVRAPLATW